MHLPDICTVPNLSGRRVLVRASLNVPLDGDGCIENAFRLRRLLPTLTYLRKNGARFTIIGHIGRGGDDTLRPVYDWLSRRMYLCFAETIAEAHELQQAGEPYVLLENLRANPGETDNARGFAAELADLGDLYTNDAFPVSHRRHASVVTLPSMLPGYAGMQFRREVAELSRAREPTNPAFAILAGAKFETKLPLACDLLDRYRCVFLGGALANPVLAARGHSVGWSLMPEETSQDVADCVHQLAGSSQVVLPDDVVAEDRDGNTRTVTPDAITEGERIVDAGEETVANLETVLSQQRTILWNGPLGAYEDGFSGPTQELARILAEQSAVTYIGGGDTAAVLAEVNMLQAFDFVSTAGGAMLHFLKDGTLPGIDALQSS